MTEIIKHTELKAASFHNGIVKLDVQVSLIIKLLMTSINENKALSKEDIINCYLDFSFRDGRETIYRKGLDTSNWGGRNGIVTKDYLKNEIPLYTEHLALDWFRKHLGSAILKGKLLAIPIIEL